MSKEQFDLQLEHTKIIKQKLLNAKEAYEEKHGLSKITPYQIQKRFESENYKISIPTISKILDPNSDVNTVNPTVVVKLCKWWDIDLSYIFSLPEDNSMLTSLSHYGSSFKHLDDPYYHGDFTCYLLRIAYSSETNGYTTRGDTLRKNDTLIEANLSIKPANDKVVAKLTLHNHTRLTNGEDYNYDTEMLATPILNTKTNNVIMNFESEHGKQYLIMFDYQVFYNAPMYYREAVMLTSTSNNEALPLVQKMIILRNSVPENYHEYVLGLLSLNTTTTIVSEDKLNQMAEEYPEIEHFINNFSWFLPFYKRPFYAIPDSLLDVNHHAPEMNLLEMKKALLLLKSESYSLAQIEFGKDEKAHVISKELQQYIITEKE